MCIFLISGGFAFVYEAQDLASGREYALKVRRTARPAWVLVTLEGISVTAVRASRFVCSLCILSLVLLVSPDGEEPSALSVDMMAAVSSLGPGGESSSNAKSAQ